MPQCVILAGGLGTRLGEIARDRPKALVPVAGRPFADLQLTWLAAAGVTDVVYSIGHLGDQIRAFAGDGSRWGTRVTYVDEGPDLQGTGGALRDAAGQGALEPRFAVLYGDSFLQVDVPAAFARFDELRPAVLMTVYANEGRFDRSNVRFEDGTVLYDKRVADPEAAGMRHIDYGFSIVDREALLSRIPATGPYDLAEAYAELSAAGQVAGLEVHERFYEVGTPAGVAELEAHLHGD